MNKSLTDLLTEIEERASKATEGPWSTGYWSGQCHEKHSHGRGVCQYQNKLVTDSEISHHNIVKVSEPVTLVKTSDEYGAMSKEDAEFIAHARTDIPKLLAALRLLDEQRNRFIREMEIERIGFGAMTSVNKLIAECDAELSKLLGDGK